MSFSKNMGKHLSNKYSLKLLDSAKKSTTDAIKTASRRVIQKTAEATGDLVANKIADKITNVSTKLHSKISLARVQNNNANSEIEEPKKRYITPEKDNTFLMNEG